MAKKKRAKRTSSESTSQNKKQQQQPQKKKAKKAEKKKGEDTMTTTTNAVAGEEQQDYEVIIIGAGAAGIGMAAALICGYMDSSKLLILEQGPSIGTSFRQWHKFTRFISPSWPSFPYGVQDLNAIYPDASLNSAQHPTGDEYADYLESQAKNYTMNIKFNHKVCKIERDEERFSVFTENNDETPFFASCVVWCGGEWSYPAMAETTVKEGKCNFDENCTVHYKNINMDEIIDSRNDDDSGTDDQPPVVVVGLGEAGVDTACALAEKGVSVVIVDGNDPNEPESKDPSCRLSPKSMDGLDRHSDKIEIIRGKKCVGVHRTSTNHEGKENGSKNKNKKNGKNKKKKGSQQDEEDSLLQVEIADIKTNEITTTLETKSKVIMCIGFDVSQNPVIKDLFDWRDDGYPELEQSCDESTKTPNLFLAGPMVRHSITSCKTNEDGKEQEECQTAIFCFVYKFRTRFAVVAEEIIDRVINERYSIPDEDGEKALTREGQMWGAVAENMREFYMSKGMYMSEITEACVSCS